MRTGLISSHLTILCGLVKTKMMKIYCDRCGIEILKEYSWLTSAKIYTKEEKYPPSRYNDSWKSDNYFCPSCTKSYIHWLSNPKKKKNQKGGE